MTESNSTHDRPATEEKITIRFIPDESTKVAMKKLEARNFNKQVQKDLRLIERFKLIRF